MRVVLSFVLCLSLTLSATPLAGPVIIRKSLKNKKINVIGIVSNTYSDIRYDSDGDGSIDSWYLRNKDVRIFSKIRNAKISEITLIHNFKKYELFSTYRAKNIGPITYKLISSSFKEKRTEHNSCKTDFDGNLEKIEKIREIQDELEKQNAVPVNMLDSSCISNTVDDELKSKINIAIAGVYGFKIEGTTVENPFVHCLANSDEGYTLLPSYLDKLISNIQNFSQSKIKCTFSKRNETDSSCASGLLTRIPNGDTILNIPIPACRDSAQMQTSLLANIFHESLHPEAQEDSIVKIVNQCLAPTSSVDKAPDISTRTASHIPASDATHDTTIVNTNAPSTVVSPEIAAGGRQGVPALNAGFSNRGWDEPVSAPVAMANSQAASSGMFKLANQIAATAIVPTAFASTTSGASSSNSGLTTSPSRTISSVGVQPPTSRSAITTPNVKTSSGLSSPDTSFALESSDGAGPSKLKTSTELAATRAGARDLGSGNTKGASRGSDLAISGGGGSSSALTEDSSVARSAGSASGKQSTEAAKANLAAEKLKNLAPEELQARRNRITQQLTQKNPQEAWSYIRANSNELDALGIHILDSNNRPWGRKNPKDASVKIRETNHKLISEDE